MSPHSIHRLLRSHGWQFQRHAKGSHQIWVHPKWGCRSFAASLFRGRVSQRIIQKLICEGP